MEDKTRRESWEETVNRYVENIVEPVLQDDDTQTASYLFEAIHNMNVMPSMRAMMTAGDAAARDNGCIYNCGYVPIESIKDFADLMHNLMNGTGVGFSVERQYINQLPEVSKCITQGSYILTIPDSKRGWCESFVTYVTSLFEGNELQYDTSRIRPKGSRLKTMGGRASGPQPLCDLFEFTKEVIYNARGRKLTSEECHEICCKIADIVVVGGVRRSALISLSNLSDPRMRDVKKGNLTGREHLYLSNNSVCYTDKPDVSIFMEEMHSLYQSKSGERGIFNRTAAKNVASLNGRRDTAWDFGTNPCSEIILRPRQFCNLTEVVVRPRDTLQDLKDKVKTATILGTIQSTYTNFDFIDERWKQNTEEERLLGVSLTGIMDHPVLNGTMDWDYLVTSERWKMHTSLEQTVEQLKEVAINTNKEWAEKLGINQSTAITCIKPSGTVSQLVDSSSGIHDRFAPYYIRRVIGDNKDPVTQMMIDIGIPNEPSLTNPEATVFSFPKKAPVGAAYLTAEEKLQQWIIYQNHWCEHKPSVTINYTDKDFLPLISEIYKYWDIISGISLLPKDDHMYAQAPYEEITKDEYEQMCSTMPEVEEKLAVLLKSYEVIDETEAAQHLACVSGVCDI